MSVKWMLLLVVLSGVAGAEAPVRRDPFWPLGFTPGRAQAETAAPAQPVAPEPEPERILTEEEVRALARQEADEIRQMLMERGRSGTMIMGGMIYAFVRESWVTVGDTITVRVGGRDYRLLVTRLTATDIELEPHRLPRP